MADTAARVHKRPRLVAAYPSSLPNLTIDSYTALTADSSEWSFTRASIIFKILDLGFWRWRLGVLVTERHCRGRGARQGDSPTIDSHSCGMHWLTNNLIVDQ